MSLLTKLLVLKFKTRRGSVHLTLPKIFIQKEVKYENE